MSILTLGDLRSELALRLRQPGLSNTDRDRWLNLAQNRVVQEMDLPHLEREDTFVASDGVRQYNYIDADYRKIISLVDETSGRELVEVTDSDLESYDPDRDESSNPVAFSQLAPVYYEEQVSSSSKIRVTSTSGSDVSQSVRVRGISGGQEWAETLELNGQAVIQSNQSFTAVISAVKSATTDGIVNVTTSNETLASIPPEELLIQRQPVVLYPIPDGLYTIRARYYKRPRSMRNELDIPDFPPIFHELIVSIATEIGHRSLYNFEQARMVYREDVLPKLDRLKEASSNRRLKRSRVIKGDVDVADRSPTYWDDIGFNF